MKKAMFVILGVLVLAACASAFPYRWYGIDPQMGTLLGAKPKDDMPLTVCQGDSVQQGKCAVMLVDEFDRMRNDFATLKSRLEACEKGK
jgi:hypothetical protein